LSGVVTKTKNYQAKYLWHFCYQIFLWIFILIWNCFGNKLHYITLLTWAKQAFSCPWHTIIPLYRQHNFYRL